MQNIYDGGAAFPSAHPTHRGMSLLDYFAGQTLLIESFSGLDPPRSCEESLHRSGVHARGKELSSQQEQLGF